MNILSHEDFQFCSKSAPRLIFETIKEMLKYKKYNKDIKIIKKFINQYDKVYNKKNTKKYSSWTLYNDYNDYIKQEYENVEEADGKYFFLISSLYELIEIINQDLCYKDQNEINNIVYDCLSYYIDYIIDENHIDDENEKAKVLSDFLKLRADIFFDILIENDNFYISQNVLEFLSKERQEKFLFNLEKIK